MIIDSLKRWSLGPLIACTSTAKALEVMSKTAMNAAVNWNETDVYILPP